MNDFRDQIVDIVKRVESLRPDIIVVEGYDGVGKGRVIEALRYELGCPVYRPNYNFWEAHALPKSFRWAIGASFLDVLNSLRVEFQQPIIFDRGMLSGMVYNDPTLEKDYKSLIGSVKVYHILVYTGRQSYDKFLSSRGVEHTADNCLDMIETTANMLRILQENDLDRYLFRNTYDPSYGEDAGKTCRGCGHYSNGNCNNPKHLKKVDPTDIRCKDNLDKEVQDRDA